MASCEDAKLVFVKEKSTGISEETKQETSPVHFNYRVLGRVRYPAGCGVRAEMFNVSWGMLNGGLSSLVSPGNETNRCTSNPSHAAVHLNDSVKEFPRIFPFE